MQGGGGESQWHGAVGLEIRRALVRSPLPESLGTRLSNKTLDFTGEFTVVLRCVVVVSLEIVLGHAVVGVQTSVTFAEILTI